MQTSIRSLSDHVIYEAFVANPFPNSQILVILVNQYFITLPCVSDIHYTRHSFSLSFSLPDMLCDPTDISW